MWRSTPISITACVLLSCIIYLPAYQAGYVTDFTGLVPRLAEQGVSGILSSYDFPALQPLLNLVFFVLYKLDGASGPFWVLTSCGLHGFNTFLLLRLCQKLPFATTKEWFPYLAATLFLLSPYQSEVVVWRVCLNYLLSTATVIGSLLFVFSYSQSTKKKDLIAIWLCTAAGLLCFEQTIVAPFLAAALLWALQIRKTKIWLPIIGGQVTLVILYFVILKLSTQQWVGHYGTEVHFAMPWQDMLASPGRYASKFLLLTRYWSHDWKADWFTFTGPFYFSISLLMLAFGGILYGLRKAAKNRWLAFFLLAFGLSLLPFLNLYFNFLLWIENDRYGYLATAFFYPFLVLLLQQFPKPVYLLLLSLFLAFNSFFLYKTLMAWQDSSRIYWALIHNFPASDDRPVYLLNLPDNLQGAPMFRSFRGPSTAFRSALLAHTSRTQKGPIEEIMEYNMTQASDGVTAMRPAADSIVVEFKQWGNWWWRHGQGGGSYETDAFRLREKGHHYELKLKKESIQARFFWQDGGEWHVLDDQ